jgi:hypothetical protein
MVENCPERTENHKHY